MLFFIQSWIAKLYHLSSSGLIRGENDTGDKNRFCNSKTSSSLKGECMARVRSEGYGAEWIEIPDEIVRLLGTRPPYYDEIVFIVSRSEEDLFCSFEGGNGNSNHRVLLYSASWKTTKIPTWVCFGGVPQYLFDNLLKDLLTYQARLRFGITFIPKIPES